uniref:Splicing factor 3B subunit 4 n=1 Tax=Amphimedon queenslandica TaxID=400682 RepID=A0A1X7TVC3_AMPQE
MAGGPIQERNQDATIYVGGLDEKVSESVLWELFLQAGPVVNIHIPRDRITQTHQGYGFVEFMGEDDADYAIKIMNMIKLYGKPIRVNKAASNMKSLDIGANLFIGNLDPEIDEKMLYDIFSAFGVILQAPKIMRDVDSGGSKGFAFVNFASFDASDAAIEAMNGQYLCNRQVSVSYAFKKESKGERHGTWEERYLAKQSPLLQTDRPHQLFADAPPKAPVAIAAGFPIPAAPSMAPAPLFPGMSNPVPIPSLFSAGGPPPPGFPGMTAPPPGHQLILHQIPIHQAGVPLMGDMHLPPGVPPHRPPGAPPPGPPGVLPPGPPGAPPPGVPPPRPPGGPPPGPPPSHVPLPLVPLIMPRLLPMVWEVPLLLLPMAWEVPLLQYVVCYHPQAPLVLLLGYLLQPPGVCPLQLPQDIPSLLD